MKKYQAPTVVEIAVDDSLTRINIPVGSLLSVAILFPLLWVIRIRRKNAKPLGPYIVLIPILVVGGYALLPYLKVPVARPSVMTPDITDKNAVSILNSLLKNIYRSFDFREEEDVYDRLATSVSGDLLSKIYLQNRKSLVVTQAGGARARVKEVEILDVHVDRLDGPSLGLLFRAKWTAMGSVGHWGHIHIRKNQYNANISVTPVDGAWKIIDLELLEEKRIDRYANPKMG